MSVPLLSDASKGHEDTFVHVKRNCAKVRSMSIRNNRCNQYN